MTIPSKRTSVAAPDKSDEDSFAPGTILEHAPCPHGCNDDDEVILTAGDRLSGLPGRFNVVRCGHCGLMRTNPRPTASTIGSYYPADYGPYLSSIVSGARAPWREAMATLTRRVFRFRATELPSGMPPGRALEVGCASGSFMQSLSRKGWQVDGIEFSPQAADRARRLGFQVHAGSIDEAPEPDQAYDLVVAWMVLEHLHDPVGSLRKLLRWTRPGGWLALSVPNAGSAEFRLFGDAWYALQLPTHLTHFTPESLLQTLADGGWRPEKIIHQRVLSNLICSIGYKLDDHETAPAVAAGLVRMGERSRLMQYLLYPAATLAAALGQTGRMCAWARRVD